MHNIQMALFSLCSFSMWIFKLISFLKVNWHSQHSNDFLRFVLFYNVYLQNFSFLKVKDQDQNNVLLEWYMPNHLRGTRSGPVRLPLPTPPSRSSAWFAWTCGLWANQWQCSSEEIFAQPLETTIVNKYTTLHKSFGLFDIVCCDLY